MCYNDVIFWCSDITGNLKKYLRIHFFSKKNSWRVRWYHIYLRLTRCPLFERCARVRAATMRRDVLFFRSSLYNSSIWLHSFGAEPRSDGLSRRVVDCYLIIVSIRGFTLLEADLVEGGVVTGGNPTTPRDTRERGDTNT